MYSYVCIVRVSSWISRMMVSDQMKSTLILFTHSNRPKQPHVTCPSSVRVEIRR